MELELQFIGCQFTITLKHQNKVINCIKKFGDKNER